METSNRRLGSALGNRKYSVLYLQEKRKVFGKHLSTYIKYVMEMNNKTFAEFVTSLAQTYGPMFAGNKYLAPCTLHESDLSRVMSGCVEERHQGRHFGKDKDHPEKLLWMIVAFMVSDKIKGERELFEWLQTYCPDDLLDDDEKPWLVGIKGKGWIMEFAPMISEFIKKVKANTEPLRRIQPTKERDTGPLTGVAKSLQDAQKAREVFNILKSKAPFPRDLALEMAKFILGNIINEE